jgi:hypothetical protein
MGDILEYELIYNIINSDIFKQFKINNIIS